MSVSLGFQPLYCAVHLTNGADFYQPLQTPDGSDWPSGAVISLRFGTDPATTWTATISGSTATWNVDKVQVLALGYKSNVTAEVIYTDTSGADLTWFIGNVVWHG